MGVIQSQIKSRKLRRQEKQRAKHEDDALSPRTRRKKFNLLKSLSPRPRPKVDKTGDGDGGEEGETDQGGGEGGGDSTHLKLQPDSQADSAINLDNQSDSAIHLVESSIRGHPDDDDDDDEQPMIQTPVIQRTEVDEEGGPVTVVVNDPLPEDADDHRDKLAIGETHSDTGISDISGNAGHSPLQGDVGNNLLHLPDDEKLANQRRSSATSNTSTSSDEELPMRSLVAAMRGNKSKSWGLIKQVVHWSPFVQVYKKKYPWVQLAGHNGAFKPCDNGTILKKLTPKEFTCLTDILNDEHMLEITPKFHGKVEKDGEEYVKLQDLLAEFDNPSVCDIKMGTRTYLEEELAKAREKLVMRKDMYEKMVKVDDKEPTEEEHQLRAVSKPRYMQWREKLSSTATLGFRIDGIKQADRDPDKNFKTVRSEQEVAYVLRKHIDYKEETRLKLLERLKEIRGTLEKSHFFKRHEVIGSSLLLVHDMPTEGVAKANIWMIDFGKTTPLLESETVNHRNSWVEGNREDGFLFGLDNLVNLFENLDTIPAPDGLQDGQQSMS